MNADNGYASARAANVRLRTKRLLTIATVKAIPCADCGKSYPRCVMDFDHRDPSQKRFTIGRHPAGASLAALMEEIAKCDVVCSNCHRVRTHKATGRHVDCETE